MEHSHPRPARPDGPGEDHVNDVNTRSTDASSFFEDDETTPIWKQKASRVYGTLFRSGGRSREATTTIPPVTTSTSDGDTTSSTSLPINDRDNQPNNHLPTSSSAPAASRRRRRYIDAWVRYPAKSATSSNSSSSSTESPPHKIKDTYRIALKDKFVRKHLTICAVSGLLLLSFVSLYLVYAINFDSLNGQTYHIFFILLIMIFAMVFCHSFARTCLLATKIARYGSTGLHRIPSVVGPLGYAQPARPIHVILARDEEIAIEGQEMNQLNQSNAGSGSSTSRGSAAPIDSNAGKSTTKLTPPPPAYGLWRSSVRINPNLLYWQRVEAQRATAAAETDDSNNSNNSNQSESSSGSDSQSASTATATATTTSNVPRPPSYASDDGIEYVVEAQPRSTITHFSRPKGKN